MPRELSPGEREAIENALVAQAPKGLSDEEFDRWFGPRFDGAIAEAENSNAPVSGSSLRRFLTNAGSMLNPVTAVKGIAQAVAHPVDTVTGIGRASMEQGRLAKSAYDRGDIVEAVGRGAAVLPVIGPTAAAIGDQIAAGDVAGGLGAATGLVGGAALTGPAVRGAGRVVQPVARRVGRALYQSALKPSKAVLKGVHVVDGGADGARRVLLDTALSEGIPVTARGAKKVDNLIDSLNAEVQAKIKAAAASGAGVDPTRVADAIDDVARDFVNQVNAQPDLAAIATVRENFATNPNASRVVTGPAGSARVSTDIPLDTAQAMKVNTYKGLRGKYGVERGATIEAEKAGARGLKEGIQQAVPEVAELNAREGRLIPLEEAIADAMRRRGNYGIFGLTPLVGAGASAATGNALPLLAAITDRLPGIVSRAGIWINRAGTTGRGAQRAARGAVVGSQVERQATSPSESQTTTVPAWSTP